MDDPYGKPPGSSPPPPDDDGAYPPLDGYDDKGFPSGGPVSDKGVTSPPASGGYPPASGGYPPASGGYPPASGGYPPASGGYPPPATGGEHNPYAPPSTGYPPQQGLGSQPYWEPHVLAGRWTRLAAALIDGLLSLVAAVPGLVLLFMAMDKPSNEPPWAAFILMMGGMLALAIYQWYLIATRGQSLGKKWLHIRIVKMDGQSVGFMHGVFLRSWVLAAVSQIPLVGGIVGLVDPLLIFGRERRCLHDLIASTQVIVGDPEDDWQQYDDQGYGSPGYGNPGYGGY